MRSLDMARIKDIDLGQRSNNPKVLAPVLQKFSLQEIKVILQEMSDSGDTCAVWTIVNPFSNDYETFAVNDPETLIQSNEDIFFMDTINQLLIAIISWIIWNTIYL